MGRAEAAPVSFYAGYRRWRDKGSASVWQHNPKLAGRELAESLGLCLPALYRVAHTTEELPEAIAQASGKSIVVKPNNGSTARGVHPLRQTGTGSQSLWTGEVASPEEWASRLYQHTQRDTGGHPDEAKLPWLIEECILGPRGAPADDIRVYVIGGQVAWVHRCRRSGGKAKWYRNWDASGVMMADAEVDYHTRIRKLEPDELPRPKNFAAICLHSVEVAKAVGADFLRVDWYESESLYFFGEITPCPGPLNRELIQFAPHLDRRFGEMWP